MPETESEAMNAINELAEFVQRATTEYRKGDEIERRGLAVEVYAMPPDAEAPADAVDVGFVRVGFTEHADLDRLIALLRDALAGPGEYTTIPVDDFLRGLSYITVGAWIGSQDVALRLFGLLEHHKLATVVTPASLHVEGEAARRMMGGGFVYAVPTAALSAALEVAGAER